MNEYLVSPVTPIVISVLAIAISTFVILTVRSRKRKFRKEQERRRMEIRVAQQLEEERRHAERTNRSYSQKGRPLRRPRLEDQLPRTPWPTEAAARKVIRGERSATTRTGETRRYDPSTDSLMMGTFIAADAQPDWSGNDSGSRHSGSSHSNDSGSSGSSSSSDSGGGSSSGGDSGGFSGGDSGSF